MSHIASLTGLAPIADSDFYKHFVPNGTLGNIPTNSPPAGSIIQSPLYDEVFGRTSSKST
jgi:hypothetical protein